MDGRGLLELKVADLREELERRNKDKSGVKQVLVDRLREALKESGHDPNTYKFGRGDASSGLGELNTLTEDESDNDKGAVTEDNEQTEPKKPPEESVPYVVQVGDQEEDLDYDLKPDSAEKSTVNQEVEVQQKTSTENEESGNAVKTGTELRRNLWISNLPKTAKAVDLKEHFSKVGKVLSATVVMSTRSPGGRFCFLQMATEEAASKAAQELNGTMFKDSKLTVEATSEKPPTLRSQAFTSSTVHKRVPLAKSAMRRRSAIIRNRLQARSRAQRYEYAQLQLRRAAVRKAREDAISRQRSYARVLAYQRARLLAASRFRLMRGLQQAMQHTVSRSRMPDVPIGIRRAPMLEPTPRRESRYSESHLRRPEYRPSPSYSSRSRLSELPRPVIPLRRSEPIIRRPDPRERFPPMIPPSPRRRMPLPSSASRPSDHSPRYGNADRSSFDSPRSFARPAEPRRPRTDPRLAYERSRNYPNGDRPPSYDHPVRYRHSYGDPSPVRSQPRSTMVPPRQEQHRISRSPPRSNMIRQSPVQSQRPVRVSRDRSPLRESNGNPGFRPKVVDYGHRSGLTDPRSNSSWRPANPVMSGHTWKPAGNAFVSNYGRGASRRYP